MYLKNNGVVLSAAGKEQAEILSKIHEECFPNYWNIEAFNDFFSVDDTHARLAEENGPVGMMVYRVQFEQADIITLAVRPPYRRRGIARALLKDVLEHMRALGVQRVFLDVEDGNAAALKLYENHGFAVIKRRRQYYRQKDGTCTDALVMSKKFS